MHEWGEGALQDEGASRAKEWRCETAPFRNKGEKVDGGSHRLELKPALLEPTSVHWCPCELRGALWNQADVPPRLGRIVSCLSEWVSLGSKAGPEVCTGNLYFLPF